MFLVGLVVSSPKLYERGFGDLVYIDPVGSIHLSGVVVVVCSKLDFVLLCGIDVVVWMDWTRVYV